MAGRDALIQLAMTGQASNLGERWAQSVGLCALISGRPSCVTVAAPPALPNMKHSRRHTVRPARNSIVPTSVALVLPLSIVLSLALPNASLSKHPPSLSLSSLHLRNPQHLPPQTSLAKSESPFQTSYSLKINSERRKPVFNSTHYLRFAIKAQSNCRILSVSKQTLDLLLETSDSHTFKI
jgi:hypothetical protein